MLIVNAEGGKPVRQDKTTQNKEKTKKNHKNISKTLDKPLTKWYY